jgi:predicted NUDIX family NTP pyrophosphohydrolase
MPQISAGLLMVRFNNNQPEFFLVHPGGPFFKNKHEGVWSMPKGLVEQNEELLLTATREFEEETGIKPKPPFHSIGTAKLKSGKTIHAWTFIGEWNETSGIKSNTFKLEWPPRSGKFLDIPEADKANWFSFEMACRVMNPGQLVFLERALQTFQMQNPKKN